MLSESHADTIATVGAATHAVTIASTVGKVLDAPTTSTLTFAAASTAWAFEQPSSSQDSEQTLQK